MTTSGELWKAFYERFLLLPDLGIGIDSSRMIEQGALPAAERFASAFREMADLERGAIANPDEKRMVGHYWLRAPELAPTSEIRGVIEQTQRKVVQFSERLRQGEISGRSFSHLLVIGIGGSALGPQLMADALAMPAAPLHAYFCDNTDPDGILRTVLEIGPSLDSTLVVVISKSGSTVETANGMLEVMRAFADRGLSFPTHAVAVTGRESKLDRQAANEQWLERFEMWDWVGGRTSLFSAVGLLPAALQGLDIHGFLTGARRMDEYTREPNMETNPAARLAALWYLAGEGRGRRDMVVIPYKDRLALFSRYLQQLVMESLGKELNRRGEVVNQGIAVYGNKGSTDQHAYVQQLRDGVENFFVTFIEVLRDYFPGVKHPPPLFVRDRVTTGDYLFGFLQGTRRALFEKGRSSLTITLDELNAQSLGALIALYERAVGFYASLVDINAYHQPGVEAGKKAAEEVVILQQKLLAFLAENRGHFFGVTEIAQQVGSGEAEMTYKILERLCHNPERGVQCEGSRVPQTARYRLA